MDILYGMMGFCLVYPLDFARTRLATDTGHKDTREFKGLVDLCCKIVKTDGLQGMYKGLGISFVGYAVHFHFVRKLVNRHNSDMDKVFQTTNYVAAQTLTYPLDTVRRKIMLTSGESQKAYKHSIDCIHQTYQSEGL